VVRFWPTLSLIAFINRFYGKQKFHSNLGDSGWRPYSSWEEPACGSVRISIASIRNLSYTIYHKKDEHDSDIYTFSQCQGCGVPGSLCFACSQSPSKGRTTLGIVCYYAPQPHNQNFDGAILCVHLLFEHATTEL